MWAETPDWWLWKEMLDAKNNNIQSQKNITDECSALNKVAIKVDIKSSLGNLKLWNVNL